MSRGVKGKVYVGLSGGVDSSVSALRLIREGYEVIGVFIKTWQPDFLVCNWEAERLDAMRVAAHLGIPFYTCDAVDAYRDAVAMYMIEEYKAGRTPNPDVMCNQHVKFGVFLEYARAQGAAKVATGHYARVEERDGRYHLLRGVDAGKDQSYFLWTLTQEQLSRTLFPVGNTVKEDIRKEAKKGGLLTSTKSDSQGICFLGEVDMKEFLSHYISLERGDVLDDEGNKIGTHEGALLYTRGQRHGFTINTRETSTVPRYVIGKDIRENTITVSEKVPTLTKENIGLSQCNWIQDVEGECEAQFRYRQKPFKVSVTKTGEASATLTVLDAHIDIPALGQSCVLYKGDECLGGGIIDTFL